MIKLGIHYGINYKSDREQNVNFPDHNHSIQHGLDKKRKANFAFLHSGGFSAS